MAKKIKVVENIKVQKRGKEDDSKIFAFLATFLGIIGFIIAILIKKDNKYVMHYAKQSLVIFIIFVIAWICNILPVIGKVAGNVINVIAVILWIFSWIYALSGDMKEVPFVGKYARKIDL